MLEKNVLIRQNIYSPEKFKYNFVNSIRVLISDEAVTCCQAVKAPTFLCTVNVCLNRFASNNLNIFNSCLWACSTATRTFTPIHPNVFLLLYFSEKRIRSFRDKHFDCEPCALQSNVFSTLEGNPFVDKMK